jgi:hypothetical protein
MSKYLRRCSAAAHHMHAYMHTCTHSFMHLCMYSFMHSCICLHKIQSRVSGRAVPHTHTHTHTHTYIYIHLHVHIYVYVYIYIYIYMYISILIKSYLTATKHMYARIHLRFPGIHGINRCLPRKFLCKLCR